MNDHKRFWISRTLRATWAADQSSNSTTAWWKSQGFPQKKLQIRSLLKIKRKQIPPAITSVNPSYPPDRFVFLARELLQCLRVAGVGDEALVAAAGQSAHYEAYFRRAVAVVLDGVGLAGQRQHRVAMRWVVEWGEGTCFDYGFSGSLDCGFWNWDICHVTREGISIRVGGTIASGPGGETEGMLIGQHAAVCENEAVLTVSST